MAGSSDMFPDSFIDYVLNEGHEGGAMARLKAGMKVRVHDVSLGGDGPDDWNAREGQVGVIRPSEPVWGMYNIEFEDGEILSFFDNELEAVDD